MDDLKKFLKSPECPLSIYFMILLFGNLWAADKETNKIAGPIVVLLFIIFFILVRSIQEQRNTLEKIREELKPIAEDFKALKKRLEENLILSKD